ncbi:uroporphyrinogen-III C-methyltransferase [Demequina sp. SYSU T00039]|uniref:uroporphyrinogen-III C-methyltransferase n=1 Tax=Demequina lignilytica TaxID=3051663 RepID=A0AAW7LZV6_9MICO|nr:MULTISPECIES: uroporphyrinogen-III C-methyltransferase [unclassified Demequina]MDN4478424.1 uroporphyrinogen-III C-methyltransferase [Demequina sp. SYSU T00039-1]MDN4487069.1 uroporphyrinogen-III C-methyltransferase [Demequina sp. SYSU T00039]MDN4489780.1 uroporphyrinogen-III C-methyltransferase [Demequina sp. SYSU T00068]
MTALFGLDLRGRRVVVAGGGTVASRRVRRFLSEGAAVVVVAPDASDDLRRHAQHGDLEWRDRGIVEEDLNDAWFVLAATDDAGLNDQVAAWAEARRVFCIDASDASRGTARQAAASTHGDLAIGVISTDAPDPARIRAVRDALAAHVDAGAVDLRRHRDGTGRVILVGSGPGDPGLITVRGRQALAEADVVVTDRLGATELLVTVPYDVEVINVGKSPDNHPVPQAEINRILVEHALAGRTVVRLKGGDPFVFGRGGEEAHACIVAGVDVEVVPGVTSALSVPARAGIPVTQRGVATSVLVTSGHAGADRAAVAAMVSGATVVILMGVSALPEIVAAGLAGGASPETPVAIIEKGTMQGERVTRGNLADIADNATETGVKPPAVIVIGDVARPELLASEIAATP